MAVQLCPSENETIAGVARQLRAGTRTCVDVFESCLSRIDQQEADIRAWVIVDRDDAREAARQLDAELAGGQNRGALHGIPIGIKDIVDVAGFPTAAGSRLRAREAATSDATIVKKLRSAGAIILGKTVTTQFACFDPAETANPWNTQHTPGGSSSGSAAAVACGMCLGAIGSQTGGSITRPASFCGIAGCKPTFGRVSTTGVFPVSASLDHPGPMARTVADLAIMLDAISGYDSADRNSIHEPMDNLTTIVEHDVVGAPKIGQLGGLFDERADECMRVAMSETIDVWRTAGATVLQKQLPPSADNLHTSHKTIMAAEMAILHRERFARHRDDYQKNVAGLIEEGLGITETDYDNAKQHQRQLQQHIDGVFDDVDVLVCPATIGPAPDRSTTGDPSFNFPWSYTGLPTISIPVAVSANGLPLAIQLVGRRQAEPQLFEAGNWCERMIHDSLTERTARSDD